MPFKFEKLQIWEKAFALSDEIHRLAITFPKIEIFSLGQQIKRSADSVVLNICEGSTGATNPEFARFLSIALRSAIETVGCLMMAKKRNYLTEETYNKLYNEYESLCKMITKFKRTL